MQNIFKHVLNQIFVTQLKYNFKTSSLWQLPVVRMSPLVTTDSYNGLNHSIQKWHFNLRRPYTSCSLVHSRVWGQMVRESKTKIKPDHLVYSLMGMLRIFYECMKILEFILIIILVILFLLYEIQQLILKYRLLNGMHDLHVQLLNYTIFWERGSVEWGQNRPKSRLA